MHLVYTKKVKVQEKKPTEKTNASELYSRQPINVIGVGETVSTLKEDHFQLHNVNPFPRGRDLPASWSVLMAVAPSSQS